MSMTRDRSSTLKRRRGRWLAASVPSLAAAATLFAFAAGPVAADVPASSGNGWGRLKAAIDQEVARVMEKEKIVGMTVAATRKGRLVFSYGYGNAMKAGIKVTRMKRFSRSPIGSTSKAAVSGPATWIAARERGLDPTKVRLYGTNGLFDGRFDGSVARANARFEHIAGMAVGNDDTVFTWYSNGRMSRGWSRDLDSKTAPAPFEPAEGKTTRDIAAMAIAGSSGWVYTWYRDGTRSAGTASDLDRHVRIRYNDDGEPTQKVKFPRGLGMHNVVGVAIRKSDDLVYVWYDDGTVSAGTSLDFTAHFTGRRFAGPSRNA
ncbi:MAG: hypothetical protein AAFT19_11730, partial [Pseudomonadota bacterium]